MKLKTYMGIVRLEMWTTYVDEETWKERADILGAWDTFWDEKAWLYGQPRRDKFQKRKFLRALDKSAKALVKKLEKRCYG